MRYVWLHPVAGIATSKAPRAMWLGYENHLVRNASQSNALKDLYPGPLHMPGPRGESFRSTKTYWHALGGGA